MIYFNGFSLINEEKLFENILEDNNYVISGFSYGAIKALEYCIKCNTRIDKLKLVSPAFFNNKDEKFKRLQLLHFKKNNKLYINNFLKNSTYPNEINLNGYLSEGTYNELSELLSYKWSIKDFEVLKEKNIEVEVYLGKKDKIIDSKKALNFFKPFATVYVFNNFGHIFDNITQNKY